MMFRIRTDFVLGDYLKISFQKSFVMKKRHRLLADKHTLTFPTDTIEKWREMKREWDEDHSKPDPYQESETCESHSSKIYL